jgi:hypothetical protein
MGSKDGEHDPPDHKGFVMSSIWKQKISPLMLIMCFIEPTSCSLLAEGIGVTLATGQPFLVTISPEGVSSSKSFKHLALNSVAVMVLSVVCISQTLS